MLWADLDKKPPTLPDLAVIVESLLGGCDYELYNSRSATADDQKARLLVPLPKPLGFAEWRPAQEILNDKLEALGIIPDRANERAAQSCYLPNRRAFYGSESKRGGKRFNPLQAWDSEITANGESLFLSKDFPGSQRGNPQKYRDQLNCYASPSRPGHSFATQQGDGSHALQWLDAMKVKPAFSLRYAS